MSKKNPMLAALALAVLLAGCGRGENDTLADGATDRARGDNSRAAAEDVGPPSVAPTDASPSAARTGMDSATGAPTAPGAGSPANSEAMLQVSTQGRHGPHLVDSGGIALYLLEGDRMGDKCVGDCLKAWPPVLITDVQPTGAAGLQGQMIATITRPGGGRQVTYNGHPLYRYAGDGGSGHTNGHGLRDKYGHWYLVSPQGGQVAHSGTAPAGR